MRGTPIPSPGAAVKLASIAQHARELLEPGGHPMDEMAIKGLLMDPDVSDYMEQLDALALLPVRR